MRTQIFREEMNYFLNKGSFQEDFVLPDYKGLNVKNILPQIGRIFGVNTPGYPALPNGYLPELEGVEKVVLFIFDGLGYNRLLNHMDNQKRAFVEFAEKGVLKPITTVFPSTTSTSLSSIFTAQTPAKHRIIGCKCSPQSMA